MCVYAGMTHRKRSNKNCTNRISGEREKAKEVIFILDFFYSFFFFLFGADYG